jgi:hypothetical protein
MGLATLYAERFQAIVLEATTKGLDKTVPLKPSGQEWVPEISAYWDTPKLKYTARARTYDQDKTPEWFSEPNRSVPAEIEDLKPWDIAITKGGLVASLEITTQPNNVLLIKLNNDQHPAYWMHFLNAHFAQNWLKRELPIGGSGRPGSTSRRLDLSIEVLHNLPTFRPPYEEQVAIATYLQSEQTRLTQIKEKLA